MAIVALKTSKRINFKGTAEDTNNLSIRYLLKLLVCRMDYFVCFI